MARKRFTDMDKWRDPWFRRLTPDTKLAWLYLCDTCDAAGVWVVDPEGLYFETGLAPDYALANIRAALGDRIRVLSAERWHLVKFVEFQYPKGLNPKSDAQRKVIELLEKHSLRLPDLGGGVGGVVGAKLGRRSQQEEESEEEEEEDSNARARTPVEPLPLSATKAGPLELKMVPGLKLIPDSMPAWLALVNEVGLPVVIEARDELIAAGKECWQADVAAVALRLRSKRTRDTAERSQTSKLRIEEKRRAESLESQRLVEHAEAELLLSGLNGSKRLETASTAILEAVQQLRVGIANRDHGSRVGGPWGPMAKIRKWLTEETQQEASA